MGEKGHFSINTYQLIEVNVNSVAPLNKLLHELIYQLWYKLILEVVVTYYIILQTVLVKPQQHLVLRKSMYMHASLRLN
jgi:hypothetical protein